MNLNATIFAQIIVFGILVWFTMKYVWPPIAKALDERADKIAEGLAAAERGKAILNRQKKKLQNSWPTVVVRLRNWWLMRKTCLSDRGRR